MDDTTLEQISRRLGVHPEFLAWVFEHYERQQPATNLPHHLGLMPRDLCRLGFRLRPRFECFEDDVRATASDFRVDPHRLATVIRLVEAAEAMADPRHGDLTDQPGTPAPGFLAAARARGGRKQNNQDKEGNAPET
jgi:hypothetical protein